MIRFLKNRLHFLNALAASVYYRFPGRFMTVIGITGTDGKTTTTHLIYSILKEAGIKASMVSTVTAVINGKEFDTGFHVTTPSPWALQKFMSDAYRGGSKYFVLETTSHALDQSRTYGASTDIAVITNISHEHLDYHGNLQEYARAKARILEGARQAVLNSDDDYFKFLKRRFGKSFITFGIYNAAAVSPKHISLKPGILGEFNLYNCLAAYAVGKLIGIEHKIMHRAIEGFKGIKGRLEEMKTGRNFRVYIDFAHKPNALKSVLTTINGMAKGRTIVIFGCAGLRDKLKRPIMGAIAAQYADVAVLTAEDPRTEDVRDIIEQIADGCRSKKMQELPKNKFLQAISTRAKYYFKIPDRQEAINFVIRKIAGRGDIVLITGKGHEQSMCYGSTEFPWDEKKAIRKALRI